MLTRGILSPTSQCFQNWHLRLQWNFVQQCLTQSQEIKNNLSPNTRFWMMVHWDVQGGRCGLRNNHFFTFHRILIFYSPAWSPNESWGFLKTYWGSLQMWEVFISSWNKLIWTSSLSPCNKGVAGFLGLLLPISKRVSAFKKDFLFHEPPLPFLMPWVKSPSYLYNSIIIFQATHRAAINGTLGKFKPTQLVGKLD